MYTLWKCQAHLHEGSKLSNLFGQAHIQYFNIVYNKCLQLATYDACNTIAYYTLVVQYPQTKINSYHLIHLHSYLCR